jgi:DNA-binding beta-propeller fold protein YncE
VYVTEPDERRLRRITPQGTVSTLASGDAAFRYPYGVAVDEHGNVYVADRDGHRIQKVTPQGMVTTLAGNGMAGYRDGPGASAQFRRPHDVAVGRDANVYVADTDNERIRRITPDGVVSTLAGGDEDGHVDGLGEAARFASPLGIAAGPAGALYVSDWQNFLVRRVTQAGRVTTIAGSGEQGFADGPAGLARFGQPEGITVDAGGTVYVADSENNRVRKFTPNASP